MRPLDTTFLMLLSLFTALRLVDAHAAPDPVTLPTLTVMADRELREETEFMLPLQEQYSQKKALNMRMMKIERELQDYTVNADSLEPKELAERIHFNVRVFGIAFLQLFLLRVQFELEFLPCRCHG